MPIKTMNNNGLQVLEEVPGEYAIYIDKDAVMTTVAKYAPGSYQTFMDRKADVDNSRSLLKGYNIEWTQQDDSDLFIQCNNEAISKIENQPMTLDEPTQPVVLEPKTVPITYECCFRVDKKTGEFYIGEGYENIVSTTVNGGIEIQKIQDGLFKLVATRTSYSSVVWYRGLESNTNYSYYWNTVKNVGNFLRVRTPDNTFVNSFYSTNSLGEITMRTVETKPQFDLVYELEEGEIGREVEVKMQLTKTSTPKPFVKSVMPSGKLDRITNANETTHTFLNKGDGVVTFGNGYFSLKGEKIQQLLVYNALLTEQEKQAENAKDIKLATNNTQMHVQI